MVRFEQLLLLLISHDCHQALIAYLDRPPPVTCVHLIIDMTCVFRVHIMPLWGEGEILPKFGIAVERSDAFYDIPAVELKMFISNDELLALEGRPPRQFVINNFIQLFGRAI